MSAPAPIRVAWVLRSSEFMFAPKPAPELGGGPVAFSGQTSHPHYPSSIHYAEPRGHLARSEPTACA